MLAVATPQLPPPPSAGRVAVVGRSTEGRPIRAFERGPAASPRLVLVVGVIHGNEDQGIKVVRLLERGPAPARFRLVLVPSLNPDGRAERTRQNGRGVDLNRNFRAGWIPIGRRWDPQYSGPRPFSEPESRAARDLIRRLRPDVTIWYHQPQALVRAWGRSRAAARRYARAAGVRYRSIRWPHGTAPRSQNTRFRRGVSFVVELPPGTLSRGAARRYAKAVRVLGRG